jgi:16S rRNA (guanine527-N7)-methyltransferase
MLSESQTRILLEGANLLSVPLSEKTLAQFAIFIDEIQRWSKIADLLSQTDTDTLIRKHILDSLALLPWIPTESRVLDLGSGAGFPGLPIAIANQSLQVSLIESRRKRANFLKESIRKLRLKNAKTHEGRIEVLSKEKELLESFNIVMTRATWNISLFLELAYPFLVPGGTALAMKGPKLQDELIYIQEKKDKTGFSHEQTKVYTLPGNEKRSLVFFTKISSEECFT